MKSKERKIQEVIAVLDEIKLLECGNCGVSFATGKRTGDGPFSPLTNRIFKNNHSKANSIHVRPCIKHLKDYVASSFFSEVEL